MPASGSKQGVRPDYLNLLLSQFPGAVWSTDTDLRLTFTYGSVIAENLGIGRLTGSSVYDFVGTRDPREPANAHHLAALTGRRETFRYAYGEKWYQVTVEPLRDTEGKIIGTIGAGVDFTQAFENEQRLRDSEARLREAQEVAHIGSFEWDAHANRLVWSRELCRIYGLGESGTPPSSLEVFLGYIFPADREHVQSVLLSAYHRGGYFSYEHRILRPDGAIRTLHTRGAALRNKEGTLLRMTGTCWDVTEQKATLDKLASNVSLLTATLDATADGLLVVDRSGRIETYNQRFRSLWGIPQSLADQGDDRALLDFVLDQLENPQQFLTGVQNLYAHAEQESFDTLQFKDGRVYERYSIPQRSDNKIIGRVWSFRDVTERARSLRHTEFLSDATRLLASLNAEQALESVARLAVPLLGDGCAVDLLRDAGPSRLVAVVRNPRERIATDVRRALAQTHATHYRRDGRAYLSVPLLAGGQIAGALTLMAAAGRGYGEREVEVIEELGRRASLALENARLYEQAHEALRARDEFLAIAAHEIRGPISSLHLAVQTLRSGKLSPEGQATALEVIEREDRRLGRFVRELLDLGRIRGGRLQLSLEPVDLAEVVRETVSAQKGDIDASGSSITVTAPGSATGEWDRMRVEQIVANLLSNAVKFGGGKPIEIRVRDEGENVTLEVGDHGIGIPPEIQERIFNPFERGVSLRNYGGLGLGLYIVRSLTEAFGGSIAVESSPGDTRFTVTLPRRGTDAV